MGNKKFKPSSSNNARQVQIATIRYERWGLIIGQPRGHKRYGWFKFPSRNWKPANEKVQVTPEHISMSEQLKLIRGK